MPRSDYQYEELSARLASLEVAYGAAIASSQADISDLLAIVHASGQDSANNDPQASTIPIAGMVPIADGIGSIDQWVSFDGVLTDNNGDVLSDDDGNVLTEG